MFSQFGAPEIIIIALLLLVFLGGRKIPEFIKGLGEAIGEFRKSSKSTKEDK